MKRALASLALVASLGASAWYIHKLSADLDLRESVIAEQRERITKLETELKDARSRREEELRAAQDKVAALEKDVASRKAAYDDVERRWRIANNRGGPDDPTAELRDQVARQKQVVDDLESQIREAKAEQADEGSRDRVYADQQRIGQNLTQAELDDRIHAQQQALQALLDRQSRLRQQADFGSKAQAKQLEPQVRSARTALQALKDQRRASGQGYDTSAAAARIQSEDRKTGLRSQLAQVQASLRDEKQTYRQLQQELKDALRGRATSKEGMDRLNAEYTSKKQDLQSSQEALAEARRKLVELQQ